MGEPETLNDIWKRYHRVILVRDRKGRVHRILGRGPAGYFIGWMAGEQVAKHDYKPDEAKWTFAGDL